MRSFSLKSCLACLFSFLYFLLSSIFFLWLSVVLYHLKNWILCGDRNELFMCKMMTMAATTDRYHLLQDRPSQIYQISLNHSRMFNRLVFVNTQVWSLIVSFYLEYSISRLLIRELFQPKRTIVTSVMTIISIFLAYIEIFDRALSLVRW